MFKIFRRRHRAR